MKKLFALLIALMMVFALAACGENGDNPSGDTDNPGVSQNGDNGDEGNNGTGDSEVKVEAWEDNEISRLVPASVFEILTWGTHKNEAGELHGYSVTLVSKTTIEQYKTWVEQLKDAGFEVSVTVDNGTTYSATAESDTLKVTVQSAYNTIAMTRKDVSY